MQITSTTSTTTEQAMGSQPSVETAGTQASPASPTPKNPVLEDMVQEVLRITEASLRLQFELGAVAHRAVSMPENLFPELVRRTDYATPDLWAACLLYEKFRPDDLVSLLAQGVLSPRLLMRPRIREIVKAQDAMRRHQKLKR
jgi:hypothetical protein